MSSHDRATAERPRWSCVPLTGGMLSENLPEPDVAWMGGSEGLLGWGVQRRITAHSPAEIRPALEQVLADSDGPWIGGWAFDLGRVPEGRWAGWPLLEFVLPEVVIRSGREEATLSSAPGANALAAKVLSGWSANLERRALREEDLRWNEGDLSAWEALHAHALAAMHEGTLRKVVLARSVTAACDVKRLSVLLALLRANPWVRTFLVRHGDFSFVGATPETLCRVRGLSLETEALAGTARKEDAGQLLRSDKELREHAVVVEAIRAALAPHVEALDAPASPGLVELPSLVHLRTPITARLRSASALVDVLLALHPTPAVNGAPRDQALAFIRREEGLERGWFAGVVGCVEPGNAEFRVALRSALIGNGTAEAFAGAGVVRGSVASAEWDETARKLGTAQLALLRAAGHG